MGPALYDGDISTNTSDTENLRADAQRILIQLTGHSDADFRSGQFEAIEQPVAYRRRVLALNAPATDLHQALAFARRDQLIITGIYGHMGCKVSAVDAFMKDIQAFVITDGIADFTAQDHQETIDWVAGRCGRSLDVASALERLGASSRVLGSAHVAIPSFGRHGRLPTSRLRDRLALPYGFEAL